MTVSRYDGTAVSRYCGMTVLRYDGTAVSRYCGITVLRYHGMMAIDEHILLNHFFIYSFDIPNSPTLERMVQSSTTSTTTTTSTSTSTTTTTTTTEGDILYIASFSVISLFAWSNSLS